MAWALGSWAGSQWEAAWGVAPKGVSTTCALRATSGGVGACAAAGRLVIRRMGSRSLVIMDGIPGGGSPRRVLLRQRRHSIALVGAAADARFGSIPCQGRGGGGALASHLPGWRQKHPHRGG